MNKNQVANRVLDKFFIYTGLKNLYFTLNKPQKMIKCPILLYHNLNPDIQGVSIDLFENHLKFLSKKYTTCTVNELIKKIQIDDIAGNELVITFDDGFEDNVTKALPLLREYSSKATFFISTGFIGKRYLGQKMVTEKQIVELYENNMEIGSHTVNHYNLNKLSNEEVRRELKLSKESLEDIIDDKVFSFSYPYGSYNPSVVNICKKVGYSSASSIFYDFFIKNFFILPRIVIFPYDTTYDIQSKIHGDRHWLNIFHKIYLQKFLRKYEI